MVQLETVHEISPLVLDDVHAGVGVEKMLCIILILEGVHEEQRLPQGVRGTTI
jgi:hypothetical protein